MGDDRPLGVSVSASRSTGARIIDDVVTDKTREVPAGEALSLISEGGPEAAAGDAARDEADTAGEGDIWRPPALNLMQTDVVIDLAHAKDDLAYTTSLLQRGKSVRIEIPAAEIRLSDVEPLVNAALSGRGHLTLDLTDDVESGHE
jgi:hypothetical protein